MEGNKIDTCQFVKGLGLKLKMWFPERDSWRVGAGGEGQCVCVCVQVSRLSISEDRECVCVFRCLDSASLKAQGVCVCACVLVIQSCPTLSNPTEYSRQTSLSMEFSRQEDWSGLPFPSPKELPNPGIQPWAPALQADSSLFELQGSP